MKPPLFSSLALTALVTLTALGACGGGEQTDNARGARVYQHAGSSQCEGGGTPLPVMQRQLIDAGITVLGTACGLDGMGYPSVCGAPDGVIHIFDVPPAQMQAAQAIGFAPLSRLPDATVTTCR